MLCPVVVRKFHSLTFFLRFSSGPFVRACACKLDKRKPFSILDLVSVSFRFWSFLSVAFKAQKQKRVVSQMNAPKKRAFGRDWPSSCWRYDQETRVSFFRAWFLSLSLTLSLSRSLAFSLSLFRHVSWRPGVLASTTAERFDFFFYSSSASFLFRRWRPCRQTWDKRFRGWTVYAEQAQKTV